MPLLTTKELFEGIPANRACAIGAFNVHNMEYTQGVMAAAEEERAPVILMIGEPMIPFAGLEMLTTICRLAADTATVPVAIALDHGKDERNISRFIELGLSVMVDASHHSFEENVRITHDVVERAHAKSLSVEGELGSIGGSEDGEEEVRERMTDPSLAAEFVERTGVDILAVSIGNVHGLYRGRAKIDVDRLKTIRKTVPVPLVMHGGSDLPTDVARSVIAEGMRKFNVGTDLKYAYSRAIKETMQREPMPFQPPEVMSAARSAVTAVTREKIQLFGSSGLADVY